MKKLSKIRIINFYHKEEIRRQSKSVNDNFKIPVFQVIK